MALRRIIYFLSVIGVIVFFYAYGQWFAWFALVVLLCLPVLSLLLSLPAMHSAKLDTSIFRHMPINTPAPLHVSCGKFPTPPWRCKVLAQQPLTGQSLILHANESIPTEHCGAWICTIRKAKVYDYLGLFSRTLRHELQYHIYVMPTSVETVPPARSLVSSMAWKPKWGGGYAENHELRLYRPGDNIQQIHWKLSAKTGELVFRQPMEPVQGQLILRMDLSGSPSILDRKFGKLLWVSNYLLRRKLSFCIQTLTGNGAVHRTVSDEQSFTTAFDELLCCPSTMEQIPSVLPGGDQRHYYIGGDSDEA